MPLPLVMSGGDVDLQAIPHDGSHLTPDQARTIDQEEVLWVKEKSGLTWDQLGKVLVAVSYTHLDVYKRQRRQC